MAATYLHQWDVARHWAAEAVRTAQTHHLTQDLRRAAFCGITIDLYEGDELEQRKAPAETVKACFESVLPRLEAVLVGLDREQEPSLWMSAVGNRGACLARLGRFDESRRAFAEIGRRLDAQTGASGVVVRHHRMVYEIELSKLSEREGEPEVALGRLQALLEAEPAASLGGDGLKALELGVCVAERCGRYDLALRWCNRLADVHQAMQAQRAARLSRMLHVQALQSELLRELDAARRGLYRLERQHADLQRRLADERRVS